MANCQEYEDITCVGSDTEQCRGDPGSQDGIFGPVLQEVDFNAGGEETIHPDPIGLQEDLPAPMFKRPSWRNVLKKLISAYRTFRQDRSIVEGQS
jgi:hypothetical protein